jgi:glycosyltransferase involved in cell wall biosynthesis
LSIDVIGLRIAITADPYLPVPPTHYGGIERVIDLLARELSSRGHQVTLIAHPGSRTAARLVPYGRPPHTGWRARAGELVDVGGALWRLRNEVDVVHSFGRLAALPPILPLRRLPKVQSYQRDGVPWASVRRAAALAGSSLVFTGCSSSVFRHAPANPRVGGEWRTIFNGVDVARYTSRPRVNTDAPLIFLGRLDPVKGAHHAISIAHLAGRRLVIAGTRITEGPDAGYFDSALAPHIDGDRVQFIGPVDDAAKDEWLGRAAAMLMPIDWDEPFGIVMAEALACGTPVIAFARGSVPEVVRDGVNGFACRNVEDAAGAVRKLGSIDRRVVRADCEARFSGRVIADQYERLYSELLARVGAPAAAAMRTAG